MAGFVLVQGEGEQREERDLDTITQQLHERMTALESLLGDKADRDHPHPELSGAIESKAPEGHGHPEIEAEIDNVWSSLNDLADDMEEELSRAAPETPPEDARTDVLPPPAPATSEERRRPGGIF